MLTVLIWTLFYVSWQFLHFIIKVIKTVSLLTNTTPSPVGNVDAWAPIFLHPSFPSITGGFRSQSWTWPFSQIIQVLSLLNWAINLLTPVQNAWYRQQVPYGEEIDQGSVQGTVAFFYSICILFPVIHNQPFHMYTIHPQSTQKFIDNNHFFIQAIGKPVRKMKKNHKAIISSPATILSLPMEMLQEIIRKMPSQDRAPLGFVCKQIRNADLEVPREFETIVLRWVSNNLYLDARYSIRQ